MKNTKPKDESGDPRGLFIAGLRGALIGISGAALSALIFTAAALMTEDPDKTAGILSFAALFIGSLVSGICAVRFDSQRALAASFLGGGGYAAVLWLVSLFFRGDSQELLAPGLVALGYAACLLISFVGGLFARGRRKGIGEGRNSPTERMRRQLGRRA